MDYIHFLVAAQKIFTGTEAARCCPEGMDNSPAHDTFTRLLQKQPTDTEAVWHESRRLRTLRNSPFNAMSQRQRILF